MYLAHDRIGGFDPRPMLDGSGVKAMPELIPAPNSGSLKKIRKIQVAKWGTPKKIIKKFFINYIFVLRTYLFSINSCKTSIITKKTLPISVIILGL